MQFVLLVDVVVTMQRQVGAHFLRAEEVPRTQVTGRVEDTSLVQQSPAPTVHVLVMAVDRCPWP